MKWIDVLDHVSTAMLVGTFFWFWGCLLLLQIRVMRTTNVPLWRVYVPLAERMNVANELFVSDKCKRERAWVGRALTWFVVALIAWGGLSAMKAVLG